jgi:tetratricopeptide (TPR) repeat protein
MRFNDFLLTAIAILPASYVTAQDFKKSFDNLNASNDTAAQRIVLQNWESNNPSDPELYVASFNYFYRKSKKDYIGLEKTQRGENSFQLSDSSGETAGFMNSIVEFDTVQLAKAFACIDKGIAAHPDRLDMRFGKLYLLGQLEEWNDFTDEIIKTVQYSNVNKNAWLWSDGVPQENGKEFLLSSLQTYVLQLYNTNDDALLENMKRIAQSILSFYPDHVESLSNLSIVYILQKDFDKALDALLKAEKVASKDYIVLGNIAQAYERKADFKNAIKYYQLTEKYGDDDAKAFARKQIAELKKK